MLSPQLESQIMRKTEIRLNLINHAKAHMYKAGLVVNAQWELAILKQNAKNYSHFYSARSKVILPFFAPLGDNENRTP
jgi:hypothetical protein